MAISSLNISVYKRTAIVTAVLLLVAYTSNCQTNTHTVDYAKSSVAFKIKNAGLNVDGYFKDYTAVINFDPKNLKASHIEGKINVKSIYTGINARDNHLKKDDFFDADQYPEITFKSTSIEQSGSSYMVKGKLRIKDVTKEVTLPLVVNSTNEADVFEGKLTIDRRSFHVGGNSWVMSDEVNISLKIFTK